MAFTRARPAHAPRRVVRQSDLSRLAAHHPSARLMMHVAALSATLVCSKHQSLAVHWYKHTHVTSTSCIMFSSALQVHQQASQHKASQHLAAFTAALTLAAAPAVLPQPAHALDLAEKLEQAQKRREGILAETCASASHCGPFDALGNIAQSLQHRHNGKHLFG